MGKHYKNLYKYIYDFENLKLAWLKSIKGKRLNKDVLLFRQNLDKNLYILQKSLQSNNVSIGKYHHFKVYDPKEREICAASLDERILHHAAMNICDPVFEKFQIFDSYACRIGKGTDKAVLRAFHFTKHYKYFIKLDVVKYFNSISHDILLKLLQKKFNDVNLIELFKQIINSYSVTVGEGIPIGNLTSQYFANYYLGYMDQYIKNKLRVKPYIRYMDDFILFSNDENKLLQWQDSIIRFVTEYLDLKLHHPYVNKTLHGVPFLGFLLKPQGIRLTYKKKKRLEKKHLKYMKNWNDGAWSEDETGMRINALWAQTKIARTRHLAMLFDNRVPPRARTV